MSGVLPDVHLLERGEQGVQHWVLAGAQLSGQVVQRSALGALFPFPLPLCSPLLHAPSVSFPWASVPSRPQCPPVLCSAPKDAPVVVEEDCSLAGSKRLSKSSIDVSSTLEDEEPKRPLPRKQSDSSTYDCEAITQHHAFLSR